MLTLGDRGEAVSSIQDQLSQYGYGITISGNYDFVSHDVVKAFQRHFRPERVDGIADELTRATLKDLLAHRGRVRSIAARRARLRSPRLLTARPRAPIPVLVSRSDGRSGRHPSLSPASGAGSGIAGEESPGSMDKRCRITSGGREPRESATENIPPRRVAYGCGRGEKVR